MLMPRGKAPREWPRARARRPPARPALWYFATAWVQRNLVASARSCNRGMRSAPNRGAAFDQRIADAGSGGWTEFTEVATYRDRICAWVTWKLFVKIPTR